MASTLAPRRRAAATALRCCAWGALGAMVACAAPESVAETDSGPSFVRLEAGGPVDHRGVSRGAAWGDFDGDGDPDLFVTHPTWDETPPQSNALYRNDAGRLVRVESGLPEVPPGGWEGAVWADFDGDGDLDLHVVGRGGSGSFFLENREGSLELLATDPFGGAVTSASMSCWADADGDGWLDVFMVGHGTGVNQLFKNHGGWVMESIDVADGARGEGRSRSCAWILLGESSLPSLVVANARTPNLLLRNHGQMRLVPDTTSAVVLDEAYSYGLSAPDVNGDGIQDVFVANFDGPNSLYVGTPDGRLESAPLGPLLQSAASKGHVWADFDHDSGIDLYLGSGTPAPGMFNRLWWGEDAGRFVADSLGSHVMDADTSAAVAGADVDGDGDVDLFVANWGGQGSQDRLYLNQTRGRQWVGFQLAGRPPNTGGVGAKISVRVGSGAQATWLHRWATLTTGYAGQNESRVHFGLGDAAGVDSLVVRWASGEVTASGWMPAGQTHRIDEQGRE